MHWSIQFIAKALKCFCEASYLFHLQVFMFYVTTQIDYFQI